MIMVGMSLGMSMGTGPVVAFAGGGTGGHLYPPLAIAASLRKHWPEVRYVFYATDRQIDQQILAQNGYADDLVPQSLPPIRMAPWHWPGTVRGLLRCGNRCREQFVHERPAVVIGTGGLASVPAVRAAHREGIPVVLLNPDAVPGKANRYLASMANLICVQWEESRSYFRQQAERVMVTGCAIRRGFEPVSREEGVACFGLDPNLRTLLITGASQGARTLNDAVLANLDYLASRKEWQILHLTGTRDFGRVSKAYRAAGMSAVVQAYTDQMPAALSAADLVVSRAGASTLAEITAMGLPSVLLPYPFHRDMHQLANARCLVRGSAARIVMDEIEPEINGPNLHAVLAQLMESEENRSVLAAGARRMGRMEAASDIASQIVRLAEGAGCGAWRVSTDETVKHEALASR
jgi:UDP-N-acetylglucosamine--N-acetylmuramyl-(pentapeptide) pyrophosphoryl-undecaprenol N-acetylglucosamine transferase